MEYWKLENEVGKEEAMKRMADRYGLKYRFVPVSADHPANVKRFAEAKQKGLEGTLGIISIAGFLFSALFFSGITGNVIGLTETNNIFGLISILIGLVAGFFYLRIRKK